MPGWLISGSNGFGIGSKWKLMSVCSFLALKENSCRGEAKKEGNKELISVLKLLEDILGDKLYFGLWSP
ncbi:hypothetical protein L484_005334 [Morus notabilis]|uniref:Uncharacterized protein n=1 Tax=Morus notabilis TaxID=981085 RepID=W9RH78_9ROSA|nr:hypothetical protein L484_005334 [Morus notabilis]